jgi:hypothetical protein
MNSEKPPFHNLDESLNKPLHVNQSTHVKKGRFFFLLDYHPI